MSEAGVRPDGVRQLLGSTIDRRGFLKTAAAGAAVAGLATSVGVRRSRAQDRAIKIGWVNSITGPLAGFGEADAFILDGISNVFQDGITVAGATHPVEIIPKDSQSDPNRAAAVAGELISDSGVDLILVASTPETVNPVADQCEAAGVPCISSVVPWQPYFFRPPQDPAAPVPYQWTYHFFWGLEDVISVFLDLWSQVETNKKVGGLFPNDGDGNVWGDPNLGFPTPLANAGYTLVDPGRYEPLSSDFSAQIGTFKTEGVEILTGVPIPPDFGAFWSQAAQQGFVPKVASMGKALLFPSALEALGDAGQGVGLSTEVWWSPSHPFSSSLTGQTAQQLADAYTAFSSQQWTQPVGFSHAIFEVAADVLSRAASLDDKASIVDAIKATKLETIVGTVDWTTGVPFPNIAKTPLVGGQWRPGTDFAYDLVIVSNKDHPDIPAAGTLEPIGG